MCVVNAGSFDYFGISAEDGRIRMRTPETAKPTTNIFRINDA